jgi:hypothetical protein
MAPFKLKPRQPLMIKAELRAQGIQALAQVTAPIIKLPMKIRRQCGRCGDFNSVLVEPGQAVPAFKCIGLRLPSGVKPAGMIIPTRLADKENISRLSSRWVL